MMHMTMQKGKSARKLSRKNVRNWSRKSKRSYIKALLCLVRSGNEKDLHDWNDLIQEGVEIITPDPKSSGGACWNFLAAWYWADKEFGGDEEQIIDFMSALYANVTVMDSGARGATTTHHSPVLFLLCPSYKSADGEALPLVVNTQLASTGYFLITM